MTGTFGEDAGLAGSGRRDDACTAPGVGDRSELVGSEVGGRDVRPGDRHRPVLEGDGGHDRHSVDGVDVTDRAAVDPRDHAVAQDDVADSARFDGAGTRRDGPIEPEPHRTFDVTRRRPS